jgi:peptidyl-prolyl cis-trans isomerase D
LKGGFELAPTDEPVIETLDEEQGFVLVAPARVLPAAPAPLASIRDRVRDDWIHAQASAKAQALARRIAAAAAGRTALSDAAKQSGDVPIPVERARAVRIQLSQMGDRVPAPLTTLFATAEGKATVGADPEGRGYYVVKVDKITPGNALNQPRLISEVQAQFSEPLAQEYARQLTAAAKQAVKVRRNESAIAATKQRITGGGF